MYRAYKSLNRYIYTFFLQKMSREGWISLEAALWSVFNLHIQYAVCVKFSWANIFLFYFLCRGGCLHPPVMNVICLRCDVGIAPYIAYIFFTHTFVFSPLTIFPICGIINLYINSYDGEEKAYHLFSESRRTVQGGIRLC